MNEVSILIPCYNAERFVGEAIESALQQTHRSVEVIVVDDGSTDGSVKVLESFGNQIRFEAGPNQGACVARNRAFELSTGKFIQYLDADDRLDPKKVARQLAIMNDSDLDVVLCKFGLFGDEKGERAEKRAHPNPEGDPFEYYYRFPIGTPGALYRREIVVRAGGFRPGLKRGQEADFHLRVGTLNPRMKMIDEILVWIRMHDGPRITHRSSDPVQVVEVWRDLAKFIDEHGSWTERRREIVARTLLAASRSLFASGNPELAIEGIEKAIEVDRRVLNQDSLPRRALSAILGPITAEKLIRTLK